MQASEQLRETNERTARWDCGEPRLVRLGSTPYPGSDRTARPAAHRPRAIRQAHGPEQGREAQGRGITPYRGLLNLLLLLLLPVCLGLTSCTTAPSNFRSPDRTNLPAPVGLTGGAVEYRIQPFDTLQITVFQEPDLSVKSRVSAAGTINYPLLGAIAVAGQTGAEVEQHITSQLGKKYLVNPQVTVLIEGSVNRRVTVLGQVKSPGTFDLPTDEPLRLLQAIARAGGFTDIAATDRVNVLRSEGGHEERVVINVAAIMRSGDHTQNIVLRPGDVVTVPETIF